MIFAGVLAVGVFGLSSWQAVLAIVLGSPLGAVTQGILSTRGPSLGVPQMVISRLGFGYLGRRGTDVQPLCRLPAVGSLPPATSHSRSDSW
jgi:purine-cytosine permease-like protein